MSRDAITCPFAKSDMTPCIIKDGEMCRSDEPSGLLGVCVGCERRIPQFLSVSEKRRYAQQITQTNQRRDGMIEDAGAAAAPETLWNRREVYGKREVCRLKHDHVSGDCQWEVLNGLRVPAWFTYDSTSPIGGHIEIAQSGIFMKHFDWCHSAAARFEDLARTEFSGPQWTHAKAANLEAARGMRELAQLIRPIALSAHPSTPVRAEPEATI